MRIKTEARVLIVDDDPLVSRMIRGLVEEINYKVAGTAANGQQAIELAKAKRPDVILMDIKMPTVDGIEAMQSIHRECPTPVVVLTAYETPELIQMASSAGAGAYLIKPPSPRELERAITIAIARFEDMMTLQRQAAELEALRQASLQLTASLDLQEVLEALLEQAIDLINADDAHIFLYNGQRVTFGAALWADEPQPKPLAPPRPDGLTYSVAHKGERIVVPDMNQHSLFQNSPWSGAIVGLPLRVSDQVIGVMNVAFEEPHDFDTNELRLLELLAAQAAIALQNAHLHEEVQHHAAQLEQRVAERTRELIAANKQLQALDQLKTKFITDISHELRTPATNVRLYLQLLESGPPEKRAEYLTVIKEQTNRLVHLVEDILYFSHLELDKSKVKFVALDFNHVVEQALTPYRTRAEMGGTELSFQPSPNLPPVLAEPEQINKVVKVLLDNALHYTHRGQVQVKTYLERGQVCLQVRDTGIGIAPDDLPHIFERFYRGREIGSSNIPGTGLGLSIAHEIVKLHSGKIEVKSKVDEGSTFCVRLPIDQKTAT